MKFFIVLLAAVALAHAEEQEWKSNTLADFQTVRQECLKENPLSDEYIQKFNQFVYPDEEPVRKHLLCAVKKLGLFCENEGFHVERVAQQFKTDLDYAEVLAIAQGCSDKNEQNSSADVWAYRGHQCLTKSKVGEHFQAYLKQQVEELKQKQ